ncbi:hypothetical protein Scep_021716 [Stephania cephalantha]|uniref:Uncharacterized protein n=1 Tax=Stephania cephalantha TaxID=152367 RepID=A0AAP0F6M4_9MAGN
MYVGNPTMDSSYPYNYGRFENSHYYNVNGGGLKDLETQFLQLNAWLQNMIDEEELCSTQPIFQAEEYVSVDTLKNFEVNEVTQVVDYWSKTVEGLQIEPEIFIALDEEENKMKTDVISDRPEKSKI